MQVDFKGFHEQYGLKTMTAEDINFCIQESSVDKNNLSDGYHTFGQLYEHRITLFIALCRILCRDEDGFDVWQAKKHHDGSEYEGWFIMGIGHKKGGQISYHLPIKYWDECFEFCDTLEHAPEWDGHTSDDVINRLKDL